MLRIRRFLVVAMVAVAAPLVTLLATVGGTASPASAAGSPCHGYVYNLHKVASTNKVKMTYWVYCDKSVNHIHVKAFLREGDRWAYTGAVDCYHTYVCAGRTKMSDRAGKQLYTARAVEGGDLANVTFVKNGPHTLWSCGGGSTGWGDPMNCTGAGKTF